MRLPDDFAMTKLSETTWVPNRNPSTRIRLAVAALVAAETITAAATSVDLRARQGRREGTRRNTRLEFTRQAKEAGVQVIRALPAMRLAFRWTISDPDAAVTAASATQ